MKEPFDDGEMATKYHGIPCLEHGTYSNPERSIKKFETVQNLETMKETLWNYNPGFQDHLSQMMPGLTNHGVGFLQYRFI